MSSLHISLSAINVLIPAAKSSELVNAAMATFPHSSVFSLGNESISNKKGDMQ